MAEHAIPEPAKRQLIELHQRHQAELGTAVRYILAGMGIDGAATSAEVNLDRGVVVTGDANPVDRAVDWPS